MSKEVHAEIKEKMTTELSQLCFNHGEFNFIQNEINAIQSNTTTKKGISFIVVASENTSYLMLKIAQTQFY